MKIYLIDRLVSKTNALKKYFINEKNVKVITTDFETFMNNNDVQCVVSPANAFGIMDGGYDLAITNYFGKGLMKKVQEYIIKNYYGEQPIGTSFIIDIDENKKLIHTPTMRIPSKIVDASIIYQCMRTTLITAYKKRIKSIVIPMFGGATGGVDCKIVAKMMYLGYKQIQNPNKTISWSDKTINWIL